MKMKIASIFSLLFLFLSSGLAQPLGLDTTFQPAHAFEDYYLKTYTGSVQGAFEEPDGRIALCGYFRDSRYPKLAHGIRLNQNGSFDPTWNPPLGWGQTDRQIFYLSKAAGRYFFVRDHGISVIGLNGQIVISHFAIQDTFFCGGLFKPYFFPDGSFLTGMSGCNWQDTLGTWHKMNLARVDSSGWIDFSFDHNADDYVQTVDRYDSTRFLVFGRRVSAYDSIPVNKMFRIYEDGTLDTTFQLDADILHSGSPIYIQEDGKVILGRDVMYLSSRSDSAAIILRLNQDGSIDTSFNIQFNTLAVGAEVSVINSACPTTDGGLLIGGQFEQYDGYPRGNLVKTDADGFIDTRYLNGAGVDSTKDHWGFPETVFNILPGQNDTYYVMGDFLMFDGQPVKPIIRLLGLSHTVGVEEEVRPQVVRVFPNPASDEVTFAWEDLSGFDAAVIRLFDLQGRLLAEQNWLAGVQEYTIQLPEYSGTVLYEVERGEVVVRGKLVVQ